MCAQIPANPAALIAALGLQRLPHEGGYFRQTWRTDLGSAILYLITPADFSALHRLRAAEIWHFHAGDPVEHVQLDPLDGGVRSTLLGSDVLAGYMPQLVVPAGVWHGARIAVGQVPDLTLSHIPQDDQPKEMATFRAHAEGQVEDPPYFGWSLLGCTMAPPWDEHGFELASRDALLRAFPAQADVIRVLTR